MKKLLLVLVTCLLVTSIKAQNAVHFDGSNDKITTSYSGVLGTSNRTFEAWIYVDPGAPSSNLCITDYGTNASGDRNTFVVRGDRGLGFLSGGTNGNLNSGPNEISAGVWTHVAFVLNSGTGYLYVNGNQIATGNLSGVSTPSGENFRVGERVSGGSIPFDGMIDELRIWNVARTQTEIQDNMNAELCSITADLELYYQLNQGVAAGNNAGLNSVDDSSLNGNTGTMSGFALNGATSNWVTGTSLTTGCPGCMDSTACNYDALATSDDGSCEFTSCVGCTDSTACNYDPAFTVDDGSCEFTSCAGCTDSTACNFDSSATIDDGSCDLTSCLGCTDSTACNYDSTATIDDGSCQGSGCMDSTACNYDAAALCDDGSCEFTSCAGCMDSTACNYDSSVIIDDGSCDYIICSMNALDLDGSNDYVQSNYSGISGNGARTVEAWIKTTVNSAGNQQVMVDWGTASTGGRSTFCLLGNNAIRLEVLGNGLSGTIPVTDGLWHHVAYTYDSSQSNSVKLYVDGVLDVQGNLTVAVNTGTAVDVRIGRRVDDAKHFTGTIDEVRIWNVAKTQAEIQSQMNSELCDTPADLMLYYQFNQGVPAGDNTGLTAVDDSSANGYNGTLNNSSLNGATSNWVLGATLTTSCDEGCTDSTACNYDSSATVDDGSCDYTNCPGCTDSTACNYDASAITDDGSCEFTSCVGCTDSTACNYNSTATIDDGSCCNDNCVTLTVGGGSFEGEISWELVDANNSTVVVSGGAPYNEELCIPDGCYHFFMYDSFGDGWNGGTYDFSDGSGTIFSGDINTAAYVILAGEESFDEIDLGSTGTCPPVVLGCTDAAACNYDSTATVDDGTCESVSCVGCTDPGACNFDSTATVDDGSCEFTSCVGCTDSTACNYNSNATTDDGSCDYTSCDMNAVHFDGVDDVITTSYTGVTGTANRTFEAWIYVDADAPASNLCILDYGVDLVGSRNTFLVSGARALRFVSGGIDANLDSPDNVIPTEEWTHVAFVLDSGTGFLYVNGIEVATGSLTTTNTPTAQPVTIGERVVSGSIPFDGIIDEVRIWSAARTESEIQTFMNSELCVMSPELELYMNLNQGIATGVNTGLTTAIDNSGNGSNGSMTGFALNGATSNWVLGATLSTSCEGCTDPTACNYNPAVSVDDGSCEFTSCAGCTDSMACNYDPAATIDDGSCDLISCFGCTDSTACNFDSTATMDDGSCILPDGCTDADACNFDPAALCDDGSCTYPGPTCAGDANGDGIVNILDLVAVSSNFGLICTD